MKTLLILAVLTFLLIRFFRGLGKMRNLERDVYRTAGFQAYQKRRSGKRKDAPLVLAEWNGHDQEYGNHLGFLLIDPDTSGNQDAPIPTVMGEALATIPPAARLITNPQPFRDQLTVEVYNEAEEREAPLQLIDLTGRVVFLSMFHLATGLNRLKIKTGKLPQGAYILARPQSLPHCRLRYD